MTHLNISNRENKEKTLKSSRDQRLLKKIAADEIEAGLDTTEDAAGTTHD